MKKFFSLTFALLIGSWSLAQVTILTQDFETGALPAGWTSTHNTPSVGWEFGNNLGSAYFAIPAHTKYAASNDDAHDDNSAALNVADMDRLTSPVMDLTPYASSGVVLKAAYIQPGNYGSTGSIEVTTNGGGLWTSVATVTASASWANVTVNLSAYTNSATVQVCFRHNDNGYWADGFGVDDVSIKSVPQYDANVTVVNVADYVGAGSVTVAADFTNEGYAAITTLDAQYTINGGAPVTQTFNGLNVTLGNTGSISFTTPAALSVGTVAICVTINQVNGNADANTANNNLCKNTSVLSVIPTKYAILEDHTGAWCQFCPDGQVVAEQVEANHPNAIAVAVHNSDQMDIAEGNAISAEYISGYPGGIIDHFYWESTGTVERNRGDWDAAMGDRLAMVVPVAVSLSGITYDQGTRQLSVTVNADFKGAMTGDLRFNLYVVEDSVTGSGAGYDQVNYYNTVAGHPFYGAGNPIVGFIHRNVVRAMLGTEWGTTPSVIPASVSDGDSYSKTYTYTLPAGYDWTKVNLVGMVQEYNADANDRQIFNAAEGDLTEVAGINDANIGQVNGVYPNPFSDRTSIEFNLATSGNYAVEIYDVYGKRINVLANGYMNAGIHTYNWNGTFENGTSVSNGIYMVVIKGAGASISEKIVLTR